MANQVGTSGDDTLVGGAGADRLEGRGGDDELYGQGGDDTLLGGAGNDILDGGPGADDMFGGLDNDTYYVNSSADDVTEDRADGGIDVVGSSVTYRLPRYVENLVLTGTAAINGTGNGHANILVGNSAANTLTGGGGNDSLDGAGGNDTLVGGSGNDAYAVDSLGDVVTEAASEGTDTVWSSVDYRLRAHVENLGLTGSEAISGTGNSLGNTIIGNSGVNELRGEAGADVIVGGSGSDDLHGGTGTDTLTGGIGADHFYFDTAVNGVNVDEIEDFNAAADTIYLDLSVFTSLSGPGTLAPGAFRLGTAAADADDRIIYDSATGNIYYDADGSGSKAQVLFAQVTVGTSLGRGDFIGFTATTTARTTTVGKESSSDLQASDVLSFEAETVLLPSEFEEPARVLDREHWSQMQHMPGQLDYFSS